MSVRNDHLPSLTSTHSSEIPLSAVSVSPLGMLFQQKISKPLQESTRSAGEVLSNPLFNGLEIKKKHIDAIEVLNTKHRKASSRLHRLEIFSNIINVVFLVISIATAFAPLFFPELPSWIPFVMLLGGGVVIGCLLSFPLHRAKLAKSNVEAALKFHKTFLWNVENPTSLHNISEADVQFIDSRLSSDKRRPELRERPRIGAINPEVINREHQSSSIKNYRRMIEKYGLIETGQAIGKNDTIQVGEYSNGMKLTMAARNRSEKISAENLQNLTQIVSQNYHKDNRFFKKIKELYENGFHATALIVLNLYVLKDKLIKQDINSEKFEDFIEGYLQELEIILRRSWGKPRKELIPLTSSDVDPKIRLQAQALLGAKNERFANFWRESSSKQDKARYETLLEECKRLYKSFILSCKEVDIEESEGDRLIGWSDFERENRGYIFPEEASNVVQWGKALCQEAKLEKIRTDLKNWLEDFTLDPIRKKINQAILEFNLKHSNRDLNDPVFVNFQTLQKQREELEKIYADLCKQKLGTLEKIEAFYKIKQDYSLLQKQFDALGSTKSIKEEQLLSFFKFITTKPPPPDAYKKFRQFPEINLLQKSLRHVDNIINMQSAQVQIIAAIIVIASIAIRLSIDNVYVNIGLFLGVIQIGILRSHFNKGILKWEKEKRILKLAHYLLENPQLRNKKYFPLLPDSVLKILREGNLPSLQEALLLSRAVVQPSS